MKKADMVWIVVADLLHSSADATNLITGKEIEKRVKKMFKEEVSSDLYKTQLVSWADHATEKKHQDIECSRNRYLFRTQDGLTPSEKGDYRLYKQNDGKFDGKKKDGKVCPEKDDVSSDYRHLLTWYNEVYFPSA